MCACRELPALHRGSERISSRKFCCVAWLCRRGEMGVLAGGRPGCPAGFESRARLANVVRRGRLNYPFVYVVGLGGGTGLKCASGICRVEASGVGESAGCVACVGFDSPRRALFHSRELPVQHLTVRCRAKCSGECRGFAPVAGMLQHPFQAGFDSLPLPSPGKP